MVFVSIARFVRKKYKLYFLCSEDTVFLHAEVPEQNRKAGALSDSCCQYQIHNGSELNGILKPYIVWPEYLILHF